jgi:outer membrane protein TolC
VQVIELRLLRFTGLSALIAIAGCVHNAPSIDGVRGEPVDPASLWPVPAQARTPAPSPIPPASPAATVAFARDAAAASEVRQFSLGDVIDLALHNNPDTRESWELARAAASLYGASRGALLPTVVAGSNLTHTVGATNVGTGTSGTGQVGTGTVGNTGSGGSVTRTLLTPTIQLSYLLFDLGGRAGTIEAAKQRAIAANLSHNATVANAVLRVESDLFTYLAAKATRDAQVESVSEAEADLAAATERQRLGVATLQEVLQTRTALSQARFQLASYEGNLLGARGNLAQAMGLSANTRFEIPDVTASDSVGDVAASVDTLINRAIAARPELAQLRAEAAALAAQVRVTRSAGLPALTLTSSTAYIGTLQSSTNNTSSNHNVSIGVGLQIPLFNGFAAGYQLRAAREQYAAGEARVVSTQQQVSVQVFTAYYVLRAASERVRSSADLLASAEQSATVALGRYREGVGTIVDVLLARSALATARAEAIQARWEWRTGLAQLAHDAGALDLQGRPNLPLTADTTGPR